jgi:nitroreductase
MTSSILKLLQQRYTTKLWQDTPVTDAQLDYVLQCAYLAPSKMAHHSHRVVALTNSVQGREIKDWLFYEHTWAWDGYPAYDIPAGHQSTEDRDYNGQYRAPVVLIWLSELKNARRVTVQKEVDGKIQQYTVGTPDAYQQRSDIYISATAALLAAEEQGLNTGYGVCHHQKMVAERLGMPTYHAVVAMGMGYPADILGVERGGFSVPVLNDQGERLGFCVANTPPGNLHWNRDDKPGFADMMRII